MPILRQCIKELIRETPADLLSRLAFSYSFLISILFWFCILSELWCSGPSVEKFPYCLTQNLQNVLGIAGLEGKFSLSSENVLRILRNRKEILLNLLKSFIYDPFIDWIGHDTGVLAAFYGDQSSLFDQVTMKKRQVEKDSLFRMFHLRTIEMRQNWITLG
ncbi:unnamed protein product [Rotaria sp. Silwood2]|nr:unnamed protein product [Rotaria sp. Silwood2]